MVRKYEEKIKEFNIRFLVQNKTLHRRIVSQMDFYIHLLQTTSYLLQTTSYNHLLQLHLLISRKRKHRQQQARNPPLDGGLRSQKGLRPFNPLQNIGFLHSPLFLHPQNRTHTTLIFRQGQVVLLQLVHLQTTVHPSFISEIVISACRSESTIIYPYTSGSNISQLLFSICVILYVL